MIFTGICIFGFVFVCVALPFALRYDLRRRNAPRRTDLDDGPWPDDPQLHVKYPNHLPGLYPPSSKTDHE